MNVVRRSVLYFSACEAWLKNFVKLNTKYIGTETWYLCSNMGIFRTSFSFSLGAFTGVYIAQNYTIPNLKTFITTGLIVAKQLETQYRKPSKGEDD
ncbi:uncharacterized protein [Physcomitrium patens]|uniref:uncharacterized protein isoform X1 n=1 Tax=Physcomitrium patens TaxID=3218 RepID=UPI000D170B28|nr:uncharacterized protein LOC112282155 isoform X2 [Physcomitrium patens]|eukprot:XP_024375217.1 uncharacterized protein LOC112282155 isoform X2 [Physcomitrella patens]